MRRRIGWVLLGFMWAGVALRMIFPLDLHSGYPMALNLLLLGVDMLFIMPPMLMAQAVLTPSQDWVYLASTAVYVVGLSLLIYRFLLKR